jgi:hypothetical protein
VIGTYGRGFWVLDDMSPLRDMATKSADIASAPAYLFKPGDAIRARQNSNWDQPINPELFHAPNPPYGALIYYHLSKAPSGEIKIEISDSTGKVVRTLTSTVPPAYERPPYPDYWLMPPVRSPPRRTGRWRCLEPTRSSSSSTARRPRRRSSCTTIRASARARR